MYGLLRKILFRFPPEDVHYLSMNALGYLTRLPGLKGVFQGKETRDPRLGKDMLGLSFANPIGLAAGFDKNANYLRELNLLGFGAVEIGTVTPVAQPGNEKPRLFRIPEYKAIVNRMGFNNDGVKVVAARLRSWRNQTAAQTSGRMIVGGNIGKNKITPNENAWKDYEICFRELFDCVDYFVVNVSSPNTPGLRALQDKDSLNKILGHLQTINRQQAVSRPILLKIAPDLSEPQLDDVVHLALEIGLDGIVAANTTISREGLTNLPQETLDKIGAGGLSGLPLQQRATDVVHYISKKSSGSIPIIASGGIFNAQDVKEKMAAGASLVQVWTGFIYEGPGIVNRICKDLLAAD